MLTRRNNLESFIQNEKSYYNEHLLKTSGDSWNSPIWAGKGSGWLAIRNKSISFNFGSLKRLTGFTTNISTIDSIYQSFIKSVIVYRFRLNNVSPQALTALLLNLKRIYIVLHEITGQTDPCYITTEIIQETDARLVKSGYKNIFDAVANLCVIQGILNNLNLTLSPLLHINKHKINNTYNRINKQKVLLKANVVDDLAYEGDEKLISFDAFRAYAWITNNPRNKCELLGCRIVDILFATGMRINEILYLPRDCWVEREIESTYHLDSIDDLNNQPLKMYGLKYFSEKNSDAYIHWIEPNAVSIVKRAIKDILELTNDYYLQAKFLVENKGTSILNKDLFNDEISLFDVLDKLFETNRFFKWFEPKKGRKKNLLILLKESVEHWCSVNNISPIKMVDVKMKFSIEENRFIHDSTLSRSTSIPIYKFEDWNKTLKQHFNNPLQFLNFNFKIRNTEHEIRLDELLLIAPLGSTNVNNGIRLLPVVEPISYSSISNFLSSNGKSNNKNIFDVHKLYEADGSRININTHFMRHNINTFLALANISEHQQAMMMGRKDIRQNKAYQHLPEEHHYQLQSRFQTDLTINKQKESSVPEEREIDALITAPLDHLSTEPMLFSEQLNLEKNVQRAFHSLDSSIQTKELTLSLCENNLLLNELQNTYNEIKNTSGPQSAKEFIDTHGGSLHIVPNGACTRNIALHGCHKRMKCISGDGCSNLTVTGRIGELSNIKKTISNMRNNINKLEHLQGKEPQYDKALIEQKLDLINMKKVLSKAELAAQDNVKLYVFDDGNNYSANQRPTMLIDLFRNAIDNQDS